LFHKIAVADLFVIFDDVPYSRKMWYNRNRISGTPDPTMLSVPVKFSATDGTKHKDIEIDNSRNWQKKHWKSLEAEYGKSEFFGLYAPELREVYERPWERLFDLNETLLRLFLKWFDIRTPLDRASRHSFKGTKSDLVLDMCTTLGAKAYLFGALGTDYADLDKFKQRGVSPLFQTYEHPSYSQKRGRPFEPFLSAIDLLSHHGPAGKNIILDGNRTRDEFVAEANISAASAGQNHR
jgi:hypothetical protein